MARFGFIGSAYTSRSSSVADEELINMFLESDGSGQGQSKASFYASPGLALFSQLDATAGVSVRGSKEVNGRAFAVVGGQLYEVFADKSTTARGAISDDGKPVTIAASALGLFIVAAGQAYSYLFASNALTNVTAQMLGTPIHACFCDGYFLAIFANSQKIQFSDLFDGGTWPGLNVLQISVFADNLVSIVEDHREITVMGLKHGVVYYDSGSSNVFDVIQGSKFEHGNAATFSHIKIDNTDFWIELDDDGNCIARKMGGGYIPQRVSNYGVEWQWQSYSDVSDAVSYTLQIGGHTFWRIYFPTGKMTWQYDIAENSWSKVATWSNGVYTAHPSQNHIFAFGKHLLGDPFSGNLYETRMDLYDYNGSPRRWLRRTATVSREMEWLFHDRLTVDVDPGITGTLPLDTAAQIMIRWSDDRGKTWSQELTREIGKPGNYTARAIVNRLGRSRYRVYEISGSDPVPWVIIDAYLLASGYQPVERLTQTLSKTS